MVAEDAKPSLLELARERVRPAGPECRIKIILREYPDQADQILELIEATPSPIPYNIAAATLSDIGIAVKGDTVSRHRRKLCGCRESA